MNMGLLVDSFWRAAVYCLRPRVIMLSFAPLLLIAVLGVIGKPPALIALTAYSVLPILSNTCAGLAEVPCLVREIPDEAALAMSLIENIQREDLNPLEEAQGLQRLIREFGLTHEQAAQAVGRSRSAASNLLRLLNLAEPVQTMLMAGDIDMGHARALLALDRAAQITAGNQIAAKKLSVREAESLVKKIGAEFNLVPQKPKKEKSRDMKRVEEELSDLLMAAVEVRVKKRVKRAGRMEDMGELAIQFGSLEELNGLIERLRG